MPDESRPGAQAVPAPGGRLPWWIGLGLLDQAVIALANAGNNVLALSLLDRSRAGVMFLALGVAYLVMGCNRAFVGEVLLTLAPRYDGARRARLIRDGVGAALCVAGGAAVVVLLVWLARPAGGIDLRDLIWVAPFLPSLLLHDTARYAYLADRRPERALVIDATWVGTQLAAVLVMTAATHATAGGLFVCWGLGATAGAGVFLLRSRIRPWHGNPRRWLTGTGR